MTDFWLGAHAQASGGHLSDAEKDEIWEWMQSKQDVPLTHRKLNGH